MTDKGNELAACLREPEGLAEACLSLWDRLIPQARQADLLARLALRIEATGGLEAVPQQILPHLLSAKTLADKRARDVRFDVERMADLLGARLGRLILLKGAAYLLASLPPAAGRLFNDIDILVPKSELPAVEATLGLAGWKLGEINAYDEQYYRRWMHQIPPLFNSARHSVVDVHHTIVPMTARTALPADALLGDIVPIPGTERLATLAPADMVLHSATHLFNEGEFGRALRDLDDLNQLLRHFGSDASFWPELTRRADQLNLQRPLYYALRYSAALFDTPIPTAVALTADEWAPPSPVATLMDTLFARGLRSPHPDCRDAASGPALWLLYVRAHYLRMPPHLLLPHLARKALRAKSGGAPSAP